MKRREKDTFYLLAEISEREGGERHKYTKDIENPVKKKKQYGFQDQARTSTIEWKILILFPRIFIYFYYETQPAQSWISYRGINFCMI